MKDTSKDTSIDIKGLTICVYGSGNISITENYGTKLNTQIAYYNVTEQQWYVNKGPNGSSRTAIYPLKSS